MTALLGRPTEATQLALLGGGASKEAWSVDARTSDRTLHLLVRRAAGGVIYSETLSLEHEYRVLLAAHAAGVRVPRPCGYLPDLAGHEAIVMERLAGETVGRRIVQRPELARARTLLPVQMADELAKIHSLPLGSLPFLPGASGRRSGADANIKRVERELGALGEPRPAIELGFLWLRQHPPQNHGIVLNHGDFRVGNFMVDADGLVGVLDWEFAHCGDPAEDLAWPLVRAWRFGVDNLRLGGIGRADDYLERYNTATGRYVTADDLFYWEVAGNVRWAIGSATQARRHLNGQERSVELAVLGRLSAEVEYEILTLLERGH